MQPDLKASSDTTRLLCCFLLVSFLRGGGKQAYPDGRIFLFSLSLGVGWGGEGGWASGITSLLTAVTQTTIFWFGCNILYFIKIAKNG